MLIPKGNPEQKNAWVTTGNSNDTKTKQPKQQTSPFVLFFCTFCCFNFLQLGESDASCQTSDGKKNKINK